MLDETTKCFQVGPAGYSFDCVLQDQASAAELVCRKCTMPALMASITDTVMMCAAQPQISVCRSSDLFDRPQSSCRVRQKSSFLAANIAQGVCRRYCWLAILIAGCLCAGMSSIWSLDDLFPQAAHNITRGSQSHERFRKSSSLSVQTIY